jgi:hypothetical protein
MILPDANWTVKQNCFIDEQATVRLNAGTNGNLTIDKDLRLGRPSADQAGRLQFPGTSTNIRTLTIGRDLLFGGEATAGGSNGLVMQPGNAANVEHRLRVGRNIERIGATANAAELVLFTGANGPRAVLELFSSQNGVYNKGGNPADLWRIEMNKGTDTTATFSVNLNTIHRTRCHNVQRRGNQVPHLAERAIHFERGTHAQSHKRRRPVPNSSNRRTHSAKRHGNRYWHEHRHLARWLTAH